MRVQIGKIGFRGGQRLLESSCLSLSKQQKTVKKNPDRIDRADNPGNRDEEFLQLMEKEGVVPFGDDKSGPGGKRTDISPAASHLFHARKSAMQEHRERAPKKAYEGRVPDKPLEKRKRIKISHGFTPSFTVDLHGASRESAVEEMDKLIPLALKNRYRTVLVITGKGVNSCKTGGVLPGTVWRVLKQKEREGALRKIRWAPPFMGGKGAILVQFF